MNDAKRCETTQHPIKVVVRRTGITADVLRAWERRYSAVTPGRTATGRRFYTDGDIERLILLKRATTLGRSIGQVAVMSISDLTAMLDEDEAAASIRQAPESSIPSDTFRKHVIRSLRFIEQFDEPNLRASFKSASLAMSLDRLIEQVLVPLLKIIGDRWRDGSLGISQEHLATNTIEAFLADAIRISGSPQALKIVVATPSGQRHRIGAMLAAGMAVRAGWDVVFLGADLPAEDMAEAVARTGAKALALSIGNSEEDPRLPGELTRLRSLLPEGLVLFIGGAGIGAYRDILKRVEAESPSDLEAFRERLVSLSEESDVTPDP